MLAGSRRRGIHDDWTKNHSYADQLPQIRRVMEIKTRLDENKKNDLSSGDQRSGDFGVRATRFLHGPVETTGIGENELAQARFCGRGSQAHRQTENSERHHTRAQTQFPNTRIDHEEAKAVMVPIDACTSRSSLLFFFFWQRFLDLSTGKRSQISD